MDNIFVPYLCGGIFFSFLIELHNETAKGYKKSMGNTVMNQHTIMEELIYAIYPDYSYATNATDTIRKETSNYHMCKSNGGNIIPFACDYTRTSFDHSVKECYDEILERMTKFTTKCFPECKEAPICNLVERTLKIIRDDVSIENDTPFFINPNGSSMSKKDLLKESNFNFQSFLVGIWHYIITKPTENKKGIPTFEKLYLEKKEKSRKLDTSCFGRYEHDIHVTTIEVSEESTSKVDYECQSIIETPKAGKEKNTEIKIYYEGGLLDDKEKKAILSFSPEIIDLDENPNILIKDYGPIYKITTEVQIETQFTPNMKEFIRVGFNIGSFNISAMTSVERWTSQSKLNNMLSDQKTICSSWFRLDKYSESEYRAEFLLIGRIKH